MLSDRYDADAIEFWLQDVNGIKPAALIRIDVAHFTNPEIFRIKSSILDQLY